MTGAQVFARAGQEEGVAALFYCPGHYGVIPAIAGTGIPTYSEGKPAVGDQLSG
jgi:hypothetical protein